MECKELWLGSGNLKSSKIVLEVQPVSTIISDWEKELGGNFFDPLIGYQWRMKNL